MWTWLKRIALVLILTIVLIALFGPREKAELEIVEIDLGDDLDAYLKAKEARFDDITTDTQKQIIWAGAKGEKTKLAIIYLHGFSATHYEIRPVPQRLADALDANLYLSRLSGHGRSGEALAEATTENYLFDLQEALAIGQELGEKVIVISASTGGTLAGIASTHPELASKIDGSIFISPNFRIYDPLASTLTWPFARRWLPLVAGDTRSWEPVNKDQGTYWTTSYPSKAVFPIGALVKLAQKQDYSEAKMPALFYYSSKDLVVNAEETNRVADEWGGAAQVIQPELDDDDDPYFHVIAGDILSPSKTEIASKSMIEWVKTHFK